MNRLERLQQLCARHNLRAVEYPNGHVQIEGGAHLVNYWPDSRRKSAYVIGAPRALRHVLPSEAVELALGKHATQQESNDARGSD